MRDFSAMRVWLRVVLWAAVCVAALCAPSSATAVTPAAPGYTAELLTGDLVNPGPGVVYRPAHGDVLVAEFGRNQITRVDAVTGARSVFASVAGPYDITVDSSGNVYATSIGGPQQIYLFDAAGQPLNAGGFNTPCELPESIAFDSLDRLWVTCAERLFRYDHPATTSAYTVFEINVNQLSSIRFSPSGDMFGTDFQLGILFRLFPAPPGQAANSAETWAQNLHCPYNVAFEPGTGTPYATSTGTVVKVPSKGTVSTFASGFSSDAGCGFYDPDPWIPAALGLDFDPAGCLYVDDWTAGELWKICPESKPATLTLSPKSATNPIGSSHCVQADVEDAGGKPSVAASVSFSVTGSVTASGTQTTDADGHADFCYQGPELPGSDQITATVDPGGPSDTAGKTWVLPESTADCRVNGAGRITTRNDDRATFDQVLRVNGAGTPVGRASYTDRGPADQVKIKTKTIEALECDGRRATAFATVGGTALRIDLNDRGRPGRKDTYRILLDSGYDSGTQPLDGGDILVRGG